MHIHSQIRAAGSPEVTASVVSLTTNLLLAAVKFICGIFCAAPALIADGIHSAADLFSTVIVLIGIRLASSPPDERHPYGHERFECIASILLSGILLAAGLGIGYGGISDIVSGAYRSAAPPLAAAIWVSLLSIGAKLALFRYMQVTARKTHSTVLRADALHQISDALASLSALIGIVAALWGFPVFDPIASVCISLFLVRAAVEIFLEASAGLIDRSAEPSVEEGIRHAMEENYGIVPGKLRTRLFGTRIYVEIELLLDPSYTLLECHRIASTVSNGILSSDPRLKGCIISVRPKDQNDPQDSDKIRDKNSCLALADS